MGFSSGFAVLWMFLQILTFLLKFRTLLSVCLSLWHRFPGSPPKWFTLSSPVGELLWQHLLQPQHPASWCYCAWVDAASMEQICLPEQCGCGPEVLNGLFIHYSIFQRRGYLSRFIEIIIFLFQLWNQAQTCLSLLLPLCEEYCFCLCWAVPGKVSALQSVQNSHKCPCLSSAGF